MSEPVFTAHALQRFAERFPGLDIKTEWLAARKHGLSKGVWQHIKSRCRTLGPIYMVRPGIFKGVYYRLSPNRVVFVVRPPIEIVTVLVAPEPAKPKSSLDDWVKVPGADYPAIHCGKLPSKQFKRILKAGNEMYAYLLEHRPDLAAEWLASIQPTDHYKA